MQFALVAITLGLAAGLKPGPLGIFIIHQTLSRGNRQGFVASLAPFITDGPIILLALYLTLVLKDVSGFIAGVSILGALYLATIAYKILKAPTAINPDGKGVSTSLWDAVKINFLNPSPYIFWLTIGGSYISMGTHLDAAVFIVFTLLTLSLTKYGVALSIKSLGTRFSPEKYALLLKSLALPLIIFSCHLMFSGINSVLSLI